MHEDSIERQHGDVPNVAELGPIFLASKFGCLSVRYFETITSSSPGMMPTVTVRRLH